MDTTHITYSTISFQHEYWNQSHPELFDIAFTKETLDLFKKLGMLIKSGSNQLMLLIPENNLEHALLKTAIFNIILIQKDPAIKNYSNLPQYGDGETLLYRLSANTVSEPILLPIKRTLYNGPESAKLANETNQLISEILVTPVDAPAFANHVNALPDGMYQSDDNSFYYQKKLIKSQFAIIQMYGDGSSSPSSYELNFKSRDLFLSYRIRSKNHATSQLRVIDTNNEIDFDQSITSPEEIVFTSSQPVKILEKTPYQFSLYNGSKKPIKERLPLGRTHNLKIRDQQPDQLLNEIFIHV